MNVSCLEVLRPQQNSQGLSSNRERQAGAKIKENHYLAGTTSTTKDP